MRCDEVRESVEELRGDALPAPIREHVVSCAACAAYAREWQLVGAGLRALAREPVPEASLGFAARVVRRLEQHRARQRDESREHEVRRQEPRGHRARDGQGAGGRGAVDLPHETEVVVTNALSEEVAKLSRS